LIQKHPQDLLKYRNFGKKSLAEIGELLNSMGLSLGMTVPQLTSEPSSA
jgi:DNA-directed RNA polymerase subunit alpha